MLLTKQAENKKDAHLDKGYVKRRRSIFAFLFVPIVSGKDKEYFFENLITLLSSGIDITTVLESLKKDVKSAGVKLIINEIEADIKNGYPLWKSIERVKLVPIHLLSVIKIGEESGQLVENLKIVLVQQQRDRDFKGKLKSASLYPIFIAVLMLVVGLGVGVFILPRLSSVYASLKVDLPVTTKFLINFGTFLGEWGYIAVPVFIVSIVLIFYFLFLNKKTKFIGQTLLLRTPVVKNIIKEIEISRMGFLLGTLLKSGFPINDAFGLLEESSDVRVFKQLYHHIQQQINQGNTLKNALDTFKYTSRVFPNYTIQILTTGEETGDLPDSLQTIGEVYLRKNEETTKDLTVLLEPILLIVIWLGVAFIAFSVILPIYGLVGNLTDISQEGAIAPTTPDTTTNPDGPVEVPVDTTPTPPPSITDIIPLPSILTAPSITILDTGAGYLNIRDGIGGTIIGQAFPGERYEYLQTLSGWYQIKLPSGGTGWVSGQFAKVN